MKRNDQKRSVLSGLGALLGWASAVLLLFHFVEWTCRWKSTAWIGFTVLIFIPITFAVALVLGFFLMAIGCFPGTLEGNDTLGTVDLVLGLVVSVIIAVVETAKLRLQSRKGFCLKHRDKRR